MKIIISTAALGAALVLAATAQTPAPTTSGTNMGGTMMKAAPLQIHLTPENNSGETGTATLMDGAQGLVVKVRLEGGSEAQPMHIHKGTCDKLDPKPEYPLKTVIKGESETTIPKLTIADLEKAPYAINVHKSTSDIATYVACGNIAKAQ